MNERPIPIQYEESPRLRRIRVASRLLDESIVLPGGYRIGLDPLIGLIPGIGDLVAATFSFYVIYQAARLGLPKLVLLRMCGNVLIEALVGEIPILGDIFDAVWKANIRNTRLAELHHRPTQPERPLRNIMLGIVFAFFVVIALIAAAAAGLVWLFLQVFNVLSAQ